MSEPARHIPRKRFGQHFLVSPGVIGRIVDALDPKPSDTLVEIGPGLGALTLPLLERLDHLQVVELDRDLVAHWQAHALAGKLTVHASDALAFDFARVGERFKVAGNLPYNISTPLLFHLADFAPRIERMVLMLQKEVVDRMVAEPGTAAYGRLSVGLQVRFGMYRLCTVPPGAFHPPPKVDSAVVVMQPLGDAAPHIADPARFDAVVTAAFGQRRKTLRNALSGLLNEAQIRAAGVDPGSRAEQVAPEGFVALSAIG
ncbi:MAG: 16S rRNA (adenine(1518)-N(6)/adenine(1519)-N(6))-dimethyltransferase RsmA [Rhodocyclaceae bacterium]|nr:16S rRNA (adenine(1518)-N(6)/adenine(1519)-N(6))-dimethyltransferase RsmA [Rhodocyclaceae bacterium]